MANRLQLERPLAVFDLETTGVDPATDRIVEIAVLKIFPDGRREERHRLLQPERPIPREATAVHGIRDEDVRDAPTFRTIARGLLDFLGDADLAGYNVARFDVPLLAREFERAGIEKALDGRRVVDAMTIYHRKERRDLSAAVAFFLGREHRGAHGAAADVQATADVLEAQLDRYDDLPRTVAGLEGWTRGVAPDAIDAAGRFVARSGRPTVNFGRYRGRLLEDVAREDTEYLEWLLDTDFPEDAKILIRRALGLPDGGPVPGSLPGPARDEDGGPQST